MNISFELPQDIEEQVRTSEADLNQEAKEAYLVELYWQDKISHHQLGEALGLDDYETDLSMADIRAGVFLATRTGAGQAIPLEEGGPVRILIPGDIPSGTTDAKWIWSLSTVEVR